MGDGGSAAARDVLHNLQKKVIKRIKGGDEGSFVGNDENPESS